MTDMTMRAVIDDFVQTRLNDCGRSESAELETAFAQLKDCAAKLKSSLSPDLEPLFRACENAYALADGETRQCYYRAGFSDAVSFLFSWRDRR